MSSRQAFVSWGAVGAALALVCFSFSAGQEPRGGARNRAVAGSGSPPAGASSPARDITALLPADPVLYVGWDGEAAHREAWEKTAAYQALYQTGLVEVAQKMFASLMPQQGEDQAAQAELVKQVSEVVREKGVSLAVTVPPAEGAPFPWGVVVLHGGAGLEPRIAEAVKGAARPGSGVSLNAEDRSGRKLTILRFEQFPPAEVAWWTEGGHLVVAAGVGAINNAIAVAEGKAGDLADSRLWRTYREEDRQFEVASVAWFDAAKLMTAVGPIPVPVGGPNRPPVTIRQVAEAVGLDGLQAFVIRSGFQGTATVTDVRVETTENPTGIMSLGRQKPITLADLPSLPEKLSGFGVRSLDLAQVYDAVLGSVRNVAKFGPPEAQQQIDQGLDQARQAIGLNVKTDLLDVLGHVLCCYNDSAQGPLGLGLTVAISVDDADKVRTSLDRLLERVSRQLPPDQFNVRRTSKHGRQVVTLEIAGAAANPSFVVTEKWLAVAIVPQACETFLLRADGKLPAWKPEGEIAEALQGLPKEFTGLTVSDPRETYRLIGGLAPVVLPILRRVAAETQLQRGEGNAVAAEVAVADLPPAEVVAKPLFPNVSVTYVEGNTVVQRSRSSLPGIGFGDSGAAGPAAVAVGVALLLPAVQQARQAARRTQSMNNLKQIALSLHNYADTYGSFPAGTIATSALEVENRLSWMASVLPYVEQGPLYNQLDQKRSWDQGPNSLAASSRIPTFLNPGLTDLDPTEPAPTHYVGIAGLGEDGPKLPANNPKAGIFAYDRTTRFADITDGLSNTVMSSEATEASAGPWARGGKSTIRPLTQKPYINGPDGIGGPYTGGCNVGLADGSVRFISENIDPTVMEAIVTISGGEAVGDF